MAAPAKTQRGKGRPFAKGVSGNPAGTSKTPPDVRAFLADKSMAAAERLATIIASSSDEKVVVAACKVILDFSVAKPKDAGQAGEDALKVMSLLAGALTTPRQLTAPEPEAET